MALNAKKRSRLFLLISTCASNREAQKIADTLIQKRLAACVNILPQAVSIFRWKGKVEKAKERLLLIKAPAQNISAIEKTLLKIHSYEVPELIAFPITKGHLPYLNWIAESTS